jgi:hypothetical protein
MAANLHRSLECHVLVCRTEVRLPTGQVARVVEVGQDGSFKIDANHRLAGKALTFEIELLKLVVPKLVSDSGFSLARIPLQEQMFDPPKLEMHV